MSDDPNPNNLPAPTNPPGRRFAVVKSNIPLFDSDRFEHLSRVAAAFGRSSLTPTALKAETYEATCANWLLVLNVAEKLQVDPLAAAQSVGIVHGKLVWEGKFVQAVLEGQLGFRLKYKLSGTPGTDAYGIEITTDHDAARGYVSVEGTVGEWATKDKHGARNSQWIGKANEKKMLIWRGAREWARLNEPAIIMGIYGADEFDEELPAIEAKTPPSISAGFAVKVDEAVVGVDMAREPDKHVEAPVEPSKISDGAHEVKVTRDKEYRGSNDKSAAQPKLSASMRSALEHKRQEVDKVGRLLAAAHPGDDPLSWLMPPTEMPDNDEDGQALIGRFNRFIADGGRKLLDIEAAKIRQAACEDGEESDDADASPSPPPPPPPTKDPGRKYPDDKPTFDQIFRNLMDVMRPAKTWQGLKDTLRTFSKQHEWRALTLEQKDKVYAAVWELLGKLNAAELAAGRTFLAQPHDDLTAYRCALAACMNGDIIKGMWASLTDSDVWKAAAPANRKALEEATAARLAELE